ncbi:MAG: ABC transporter ATP-binding protein [Desulfobacterium sp.]|nr:ABC transporter ATP-binding protein [Desulfobacterium sp.]MBU3946963.1 ABC transporter ATP-binding protein [Pseudomonadota bacterium]MBU4037236.1 ABC transporter ATP-binding protein [Pseudomonadota bacterium]
MILLENLTKKYGEFTAVDNLTLSIPKGEIFGFLGPNGAGKTTTIKMMGGIMEPTSGLIKIGGISMKDEPEKAKKIIGFIPDRPYLYEKLTGKEFLRFIGNLYGVSDNNFSEKADNLLDMFSLIKWADELIESYSHGMKQRLIMAAALLHDPEVIIIDEPMVGLDPVAARMVKDLLKHLASNGLTVFMSTHTLQVAEDVCHRIGIIKNGLLIATGTADDLKKKSLLIDPDLEDAFIKLTS